MITAKEAAEIVKKTQKYEQVVRVKDYDKNHYVVEALPEANKLVHGIQTLFGVDKKSGEVTAFNITNLGFYLSRPTLKF